MAGKNADREYDIVLLGATGYTGALTAEHIAEHLPTNLKWAIAGRSQGKLEALAAKLKKLNPDRVQPAIEVVSLDERSQIDAVIKKSRVCISIVAYFSVGTQIVEACIENGTDYVDANGDIPVVHRWIQKYHERAKAAGVVLIHALGVLSSPHDLLVWAAVRELKRETSLNTKEVILTTKPMALEPSGGSLESIMNYMTLDPKSVEGSRELWALSPVKGSGSTSDFTNFLGLRHDADLGLLASCSVAAWQNQAIIYRTWGLFNGGKDYGPNFQYNEYESPSSTIDGIRRKLASSLLNALLGLSSARLVAVVKRFLPAPGTGPDVEKLKRQPFEMELVATADTEVGRVAPRAYANIKYTAGSYVITALFLAQGAASLLYSRKLEGEITGGCLTPAFLGEDLLERIRSVGVEFETKML